MSKQQEPRKVDRVPEGYTLGELRNGIQYYVKKSDNPGIPASGTPPPTKRNPKAPKVTYKPRPYLPPKPTNPVNTKDEVFLETPKVTEPTPKETVLYGGVKGYGRNVVEAGNSDYSVMEFPDETGNYTNKAQRLYFDKSGNEISTPDVSHYVDGKFTPVLTGRKLDDIRLSQGIQQVNSVNDSGVNNRIDIKAPNFLKPNSVIDINSGGGSGVNPSTVNQTVKGATDTYIPKKFDINGKEISVDSGLKPLGTSSDSKEVGKMLDVEQPRLIKGNFSKGGLVSKVMGKYAVGGNINHNEFGVNNMGVIGQNDPYAVQKQEESKKTKVKQDYGKTGVDALGALGSGYYATRKSDNAGDVTYNQGMQAVGQFGGIGKVIQGAAAVGDMIGDPIRKNAEGYNKTTGEYNDMDNAKTAGAIGSHLNPYKNLTTVLGDKDASLKTKIMVGATGGAEGTGAYYKDKEKARKSRIDKATKEVENANKQDKIQQAILARDNNDFNPKTTTLYNTNGMTFDENQNVILSNGQQFDPNKKYNKGGLVSKVMGYADGGVIKGKGTGKSDSINAKVKADSFIVPAKNAEVAEELREKLLKQPPKSKANLNQKGGESVKVSNGEHLFTPEEKEELLERGVNVDLLAPNSETKTVNKDYIKFPKVVGLKDGGLTPHKAKEILHDKSVHGHPLTDKQRKYMGAVASGNNRYAEGGDVVDPAKELAKIKAEREAIANIEKKRESDRTQAEKNALQKFVLEAKAKDKADKTTQWEKKYNDAKTKHDALQKEYESTVKSFEGQGNATSKDRNIGVAGTKDAEYQRKTKEDLLKKISDAKNELVNAERTYKYVKSDSYGKTNATPSKSDVKVPEAKPKVAATEVKTEAKPVVKAPSVNSVAKTTTPSVNLPSKDLSLTGLKEDAALRKGKVETSQDAAISAMSGTTPTSTTTTITNPQAKRTGLGGLANRIDPTMLAGVGQTALGLNMLRNEKRPIDQTKLDPTFNENVNRAQADAKFGYTPEQNFALEQARQNAVNDSRYSARNFAGGNAGTAFNQERQAINQGWMQKLGLANENQNLRMEKQRYADQQAQNRGNINMQLSRNAFNNAMDTFQQKQQAGSELIGAGINNTIGALRYQQELDAMEKADKQRNAWLGNI